MMALWRFISGGNIQIIAGNNNIVNSYKTGIHNKGTGNIILIAGNGTAANTAVMRDGELTESNIITAGTDGINVESKYCYFDEARGSTGTKLRLGKTA